ncbi:MAG: hypothetical protein ACRD03_07725 [Acidimicrobiales bacterium]
MTLLRTEVRRALHRRMTWGLIGLALAGVVVAGVTAFFSSSGLDLARAHLEGEESAAVMRHWWVPGAGEGLLLVAAFFLAMGGLVGGASVTGAEWRAGTVGTLLTWEPRRLRLHAARVGACAALALVVSFALQALFLASFVPAVAAHGTASGVDGAWWASLVAAMARISLLSSLATVVGASLATLGRTTTAALVAGWGWMAVGENLVRNLVPDLRPLLLGENTAVLLTWGDLEGAGFSRDPAVALATLVAYGGVLAAVAAARFLRQDVTGA